jgi:hypothetical protein
MPSSVRMSGQGARPRQRWAMNGVGIHVQAAQTSWSMVREPVPVSLENESRHFRPGTARCPAHVPSHLGSPSPQTRRGTRRGLPLVFGRRRSAPAGSGASRPSRHDRRSRSKSRGDGQARPSRRVAIARRRASCRARPSNVGSTLAWATLLARSGAKTGRCAYLLTIVARFASRGHSIADMAEKVTQDRTEEGMARAEKGACSPGDDRCSPSPTGSRMSRRAACHRDDVGSGGSWPTANARAGTSGSISRLEKGGCSASRGEVSYLVNQSDPRSDTLSPRAATARPARMSANRTAEGRLG